MNESAVTPNRTTRQRAIERREANEHVLARLANARSDPAARADQIATLRHLVGTYYGKADYAETSVDAQHWARIARQYQSALDDLRYSD